jgi:hypothetical protein
MLSEQNCSVKVFKIEHPAYTHALKISHGALRLDPALWLFRARITRDDDSWVVRVITGGELLERDFNAMAKAEPNLAEANHPEPDPGTVAKTIEVGQAFAVLRSENASLRSENDQLKINARIAAQNNAAHKKNTEHWQGEILKLQEQLLASQKRVYELQDKLLSLREIVNSA